MELKNNSLRADCRDLFIHHFIAESESNMLGSFFLDSYRCCSLESFSLWYFALLICCWISFLGVNCTNSFVGLFNSYLLHHQKLRNNYLTIKSQINTCAASFATFLVQKESLYCLRETLVTTSQISSASSNCSPSRAIK